jgi:GMP synthase (glutamine-hydrolysing)
VVSVVNHHGPPVDQSGHTGRSSMADDEQMHINPTAPRAKHDRPTICRVRPFLLLSTRAEDTAADDEYAAFLRLTGLPVGRLRRLRMEAGPLPRLDLDDYAGVFLGGGPFESSDPPATKSAVQRRIEQELDALLEEIVERDFPFLGACYGVGTLGVQQGGVVDRTYAEPVGCVRISLTPAGCADPLAAGMPEHFNAFVGHKEACRVLPPTAVLLATSPQCPVQMFRVKRNVYATQFHPELDVPGIVTRVRVYQHAGYFPPAELEPLVARLSQAVVTEPPRLLANFVARYA